MSEKDDSIAELGRRLHRFEPRALLRALAESGIDFHRIRFDSHLVSSLRASGEYLAEGHGASGGEGTPARQLSEGVPYSGPHPRLFHSLRRCVESQADADVELTSNLGLLSGRSPIPSYFLKYFTHSAVQRPLFELLRLLDHVLIRDRLETFAPEERSESLAAVQRNLLPLGGVAAPCFVDWLFRRVFPELRVAVRRETAELPLSTARAAVGYSALGAAVLCGGAQARDAAVEVTLATADAAFGDGSWRSEAERRVHAEILRWLKGFDLTLRVVLLSYAGSEPEGPSLGNAELDFDALAVAPRPLRTLVFAGSLAAR